jgi:hypothetical protein
MIAAYGANSICHLKVKGLKRPFQATSNLQSFFSAFNNQFLGPSFSPICNVIFQAPE